LVEWGLEQKCFNLRKGLSMADIFGAIYCYGFTFLYSFYVLGKKCKYFYLTVFRCEVSSLCDFEKFRPVRCDVMRALRHHISPKCG
jgi:hypothetical protein